MPSHTDTAGHTKAFIYPVMDHWGKVKVLWHEADLNRRPVGLQSNTPTSRPRWPPISAILQHKPRWAVPNTEYRLRDEPDATVPSCLLLTVSVAGDQPSPSPSFTQPSLMAVSHCHPKQWSPQLWDGPVDTQGGAYFFLFFSLLKVHRQFPKRTFHHQ